MAARRGLAGTLCHSRPCRREHLLRGLLRHGRLCAGRRRQIALVAEPSRTIRRQGNGIRLRLRSLGGEWTGLLSGRRKERLRRGVGRQIGQAALEERIRAGQLLRLAGNHRGGQIISYLENITVANDPITGEELWRHTRGHGYAEHAAWPIWNPPYLLYSEPFREGTQALKLDYLDDSPRMQEIWHSDVLCNDIFSSVIVNGHIYGFDLFDFQAIHGGHFKCIELATGKEKWAVTNTTHATVLTDQTNLLVLNELGELILAAADPAGYREKARAQIFQDIQCWVAPAYHDGRLLVRGGSNVACVYLGDPAAERLKELRSIEVVANAVIQPGILERFRGETYFAPTLKDLNEWLWFSLVGVVLPTGMLTFAFRRKLRGVILFGGGTFMIGLIACPVFTAMFERLVFTWPVALHASYFAVAQICVQAVQGNDRRIGWAARGGLLGFVGICAGYQMLCRDHFIVAGWGFLTGILPAFLVTLTLNRFMNRPDRNTNDFPTLVPSWTASFVVFYWSAAIFIHLRT